MFWSEIRSGVRGRLESGIQKIFCGYNPESWALESRIQLKESIILPAIGIWIQVPLTRNPESRVFNSESTIQDCLGLPYISGATQFWH